MPSFWVTYEGTRFPVRRGETLVGRSAYCTIIVSDVSVSREHASLRLVDGVLLLTDLGSRNGTSVNGDRVNGTQSVQAGDTILVGSALLRIEATEDDERSRRKTGNLVGEGPDDPTTQSTTTMVELAFRLVGQAEAMGNRQKAVGLVHDVVDSIVESVGDGYKLRDSDGPKLTRVIAFVVSASGDPAMARWQADVLAKLGLGT